jgi:LPS-assembly lipoprotein
MGEDMLVRAVRPAFLALAAATLAAPLAGCGFTPLYATPGMVPSLEAVDVVAEHQSDPREVPEAALANRVRFLLREQLNDELGHQGKAPVRYQLTYTSSMIRIPRGIRVNNVANRYEINLTVRYVLTAVGNPNPVLVGTAPVIVDYDSPDPPYAGVAAEQDGEARAANQAAIAIRLDLARFFAGVHSGSHAVVTPVVGDGGAIDMPTPNPTGLDTPD